MRGMLLYQTNKFAGAIRDFDFAVSKNPSDFKNFAFRGWSYFYIGSYREAIEDFDSVLKLSPNETTFRRFRGLAYYFLDNYEKTVDDITEELKINDNPQIENYKIRANAYRKLGKNDLAEKDEKKYAEMGGDLSEIVIEKPVNVSVGTFVYDTEKVKSIRQSIYQSINEKNFDGAFKEVEELIKNVPTPENINLKSLIFTARGANYFKLGEYQKALEDLNEALKLNAGSHLAYQGRAAAYRKLGRIKEAEADEAKYEELKPKAP